MKKSKLIINFDPQSGQAFSDMDCERMANEMCKHRGTHTVGNSLLIDFVRGNIRHGMISCKDVEFHYGESFKGMLSVQANGRFYGNRDDNPINLQWDKAIDRLID
jgi:hypothetical protein